CHYPAPPALPPVPDSCNPTGVGNTSTVPAASTGSTRWVQLTAGILAMVAVANFQYAWTLFVPPLEKAHSWSTDEIQVAFFVFFVLSQTWLVPFEAYLADRFGPRLLVVCGGLLCTTGWVVSSGTASLRTLYFAQALSGCGSGVVYGVSMGS